MQKTADEVTVKQVHIKDRFWSEIQNRIINVVIPFLRCVRPVLI